MSSRRTVRQLLVAVLVGILVGGGLMAVTPAGAEVSSALATNWKKIWNKELKPQADQRYYTKKKSNKRYYTKSDSDAKYQPKGNYALNGSSYTKAESDSKYAGAGSSYSKAESDGRYVSKTVLRRGTFALGTTAAAANEFLLGDISYGVTLTVPPAAHYIPLGAPVPAGCAGDAANPDAQPGNLCVFESAVSNADTTALFAITTDPGSSTMGAWVRSLSVAAGTAYVGGSWAMRPGTLAAGQRPALPRGQLVP
jgi:hypothetical protein